MEYIIYVEDFVWKTAEIFYAGTDPLEALKVYFQLHALDDETGCTTLQKTSRQHVDKRERRFAKYRPVCPSKLMTTTIEDELPF